MRLGFESNVFLMNAFLSAMVHHGQLADAAPLLLFAAAARRLTLATLGLLQYLGPTLQFAEAVLIFGEPLRPVHVVTFFAIWTGCALYAWDAWRRSRMVAAIA